MKKRIITAIVLAGVLVPFIFIGGLPLEILITLISMLGLKEIIDLYEKEKKLPILLKIFSFLSVGMIVLSSDVLLCALALTLLLILVPIIFIDNNEYSFNDASFLFGVTSFFGVIFYLINNLAVNSLEEFIYILSISILTDTFALFGGKLFGKHKLIPSVSPNKTIEGSLVGTLVGTLGSCFIYLFIVDLSVSILLLIIMSLVISIMGQIGDLLFSSIKRFYKVKDFSDLLPGHGGILDRFDNLIISVLTYTIIKILFL